MAAQNSQEPSAAAAAAAAAAGQGREGRGAIGSQLEVLLPPPTPKAAECPLICERSANGNLVEVKGLLALGADPRCHDRFGRTPLMHAAKNGHTDVVRCLLDAGTPWNAVDASGKCAGDYAMEAGHQSTFDLLVDTGVQSELIFGALEKYKNKTEFSNKHYLEERVMFSEDKLLDEESKGIMMSWEKPLMEAHARAVCAGGGDILNVGFGMGLVDTAIQSYQPTSHTIIEAHPEVYKRMIASGWAEKANVHIIFGQWQDVLPSLGVVYDGIFFDTYGEHYEDLKEFHDCLPQLLKPGGIYSFFNGLCADNAFFHVVYCQLVSLVLSQMDFTIQFIPLPVKDCLDEKTWEGVSHKYWQLDTYFLPVCQKGDERENCSLKRQKGDDKISS
ncbi:hypothetical protein GOP47_0000319 [Adiantum capillus-veneris]|uniref:Protein arginine N-methyltransferase 2 n=1 Tax=Adiantum capillus-veneris TaxID=13818 RepID=A0A9D4VCT3_ADICA|nr:hypothetical protein GOP47_0000319 [Adiantum capillus-veneris]